MEAAKNKRLYAIDISMDKIIKREIGGKKGLPF